MSRAGLIRAKGAAVTFTHTVPGTHDPEMGTFGAPVVTTVKGWAMRSPGDPVAYRARELIETEAITMDFTPKTAGDLPAKDSVVTFGDVGYTVRAVESIAPNGVSQGARVVVST